MVKKIYYRSVYKSVRSLLLQHPAVSLFASFGVGKTLFVKRYFSDYQYVSLRNEQAKQLLLDDPFRFFSVYGSKTIIDDAEQVEQFSELLFQYSISIYQSGSYLILSSLKPQTSETNQIPLLELLPLSIAELKLEQEFGFQLEESILRGGYPQTTSFFRSKSFQEQFKRQFKLIVSVQDEQLPWELLRACAAYIDRSLNVNELAKNLKLTQPTVNAWLNYFERLGLIYLLKAYPQNFKKRTIKHAKLYFFDTGLASFLLGLKEKKNLLLSPYFKALTHNFYLMELLKKNALEPRKKDFFYWRESNGHEIHLLIQHPTSVDAYQFTSSHEFQGKMQKELDFFDEISDGIVLSKNIVYSGFKNQTAKNANLLSWQMIS